MSRKLVQLKTIPQTVLKCKEMDPETEINYSMLYSLVREGKLSYEKHGVRVILDYSAFLSDLLDLLGLDRTVKFPKIRTIGKCAGALRGSAVGVCDKVIRRFVREGLLPSIRIGNRHYVALQFFDDYHYEKFIFRFLNLKGDRFQTEDDAMEQIRNIADGLGSIRRKHRQMARLKT